MAFALAACGAPEPAPETNPAAAGSPAPRPEPSERPTDVLPPLEGKAGSKRFDALTIRMTLRSSSVVSGRSVGAQLSMENRSGRAVTDPSCWFGNVSYALVPEGDPDPDLWLRPVVDCGGPFTFERGYSDTSHAARFPARTSQGDPLPPGDYVAMYEIRGRSGVLEVPVEVVEAP